jgi:hypothetical protein
LTESDGVKKTHSQNEQQASFGLHEQSIVKS